MELGGVLALLIEHLVELPKYSRDVKRPGRYNLLGNVW
jgi:hypothetical protein